MVSSRHHSTPAIHRAGRYKMRAQEVRVAPRTQSSAYQIRRRRAAQPVRRVRRRTTHPARVKPHRAREGWQGAIRSRKPVRWHSPLSAKRRPPQPRTPGVARRRRGLARSGRA
eukprot:scaffold324374_cov61-Tisochrysis_lutea.AAC.2